MFLLGTLDKASVIGHLKDGGVTDPEVVRSRYMQLRSQGELISKILLAPLILGCIQIAVGIIGLIILVGIFLLIIGGVFAGGAWWLRSRIQKNLLIVDEAYREYTARLGAPAA